MSDVQRSTAIDLSLWVHLGKNASRPIRRDHRLCFPDTSSAHLPVSSKSHRHWYRVRSLRWQCLPAMEAQVFLRAFQVHASCGRYNGLTSMRRMLSNTFHIPPDKISNRCPSGLNCGIPIEPRKTTGSAGSFVLRSLCDVELDRKAKSPRDAWQSRLVQRLCA